MLTLGAAAKMAGVSKPTIARAIKSGKLSGKKNRNGSYSIDESELARVYDVTPRDSNDTGPMLRSVTPDVATTLQAENDGLRQRLADMETALAREKEQADEWRTMAKTNSRLLEDNREKSKRRWWWQR